MKESILLLAILLFTTYVIAQENEEPHFIGFYFTDRKGEKIVGSVTPSDKFVYLVIETKNAIGEDVRLTLDEDESYFYKRKFLAGGSSIKFKIKEEFQKVKLVIYNPNIKRHIRRRMRAVESSKAEDAKE